MLREVLDAGAGLSISFFEATIAAAFLAFSRTPADACVIEVGLGGRFDATNVIERPAVCGIASLGIDHERFLLAPEAGTPEEPLARIAFEKAGIAKPGVPLVTQFYVPAATREIIAAARRVGAPLAMRGDAWSCSADTRLTYRDSACMLSLPLPTLSGAHQVDNAALAIAMIQHQQALTIGPMAMTRGLQRARWPARLQRLGNGPLALQAKGREIWLDGGHNPDAGTAIARHFAGRRLHIIVGMLANKDPQAMIAPLGERIASLQAVPVTGHDHHRAEEFGPAVRQAASVAEALGRLPADDLPVLICGSLYLAGEVLRANDEVPD